MPRGLLAIAIALSALLASASAQARTRVCVHVRASEVEATALRRLVMTELNRHTTHQAADQACESRLSVELVELGSERYLTGRLDDEVPHRERGHRQDGAGGGAAAHGRAAPIHAGCTGPRATTGSGARAPRFCSTAPRISGWSWGRRSRSSTARRRRSRARRCRHAARWIACTWGCASVPLPCSTMRGPGCG
jgi:hypothetical protein